MSQANKQTLGGGSNPIFAHGKMYVFPFSPWEKWEKKYMERKGKVFISLSFHILFSPWENTNFSWAKMGLDPPPPPPNINVSLASSHYCMHIEEYKVN